MKSFKQYFNEGLVSALKSGKNQVGIDAVKGMAAANAKEKSIGRKLSGYEGEDLTDQELFDVAANINDNMAYTLWKMWQKGADGPMMSGELQKELDRDPMGLDPLGMTHEGIGSKAGGKLVYALNNQEGTADKLGKFYNSTPRYQ